MDQSCTPTRRPAFEFAWPGGLIVPDVFAARGRVMVAYRLCAQAVGTLAALLLPLRRSLPALAVAVAVIMMIVLNRYVERYREDFRPTAAPPRRTA